jgi:nucleotide-binding universal stress UspA family protein
MPAKRNLILGFDDSECAKAALAAAIELAERFGDRLVISYAYGPPDRLRGEEYHEHQNALREIGERVTGGALQHAREAGIDAEVVLVAEKPADALVDLARARDARLIVVGSYGEGPIVGALLGSVPFKLLHRSPVPVLVVPAPG